MLKASMPKKTDIEARQYTNQRLHKLYWHTGNSQADGLGDVYLDCAMVYGDDPEDSKQGQIIKDSAQRTSVSGIGPSVSWGVVGGVMGSIVGIIILIKIFFTRKIGRVILSNVDFHIPFLRVCENKFCLAAKLLLIHHF